MDTLQETKPLGEASEPATDRMIRNDGRYTVFQSAKVIAFQVDEDITIPKGHILVFPLNQPNTWVNLTRSQFAALFNETNEDAETIFRRSTYDSLHIPNGIQRPLASPRNRRRQPIQNNRSRNGVSPQLGRILAAMVYASKTLGVQDLTTKQVKPYLHDRDKPQYSARLPHAIEKGLVQRGNSLPEQRGFHYQITQRGLEVVKDLGAWVFTQDKLTPPDWLETLSP